MSTKRVLLRLPEAADALGVSRSTLYRLIGQGQIPVRRVGRSPRIMFADLEAWAGRLPCSDLGEEGGHAA